MRQQRWLRRDVSFSDEALPLFRSQIIAINLVTNHCHCFTHLIINHCHCFIQWTIQDSWVLSRVLIDMSHWAMSVCELWASSTWVTWLIWYMSHGFNSPPTEKWSPTIAKTYICKEINVHFFSMEHRDKEKIGKFCWLKRDRMAWKRKFSPRKTKTTNYVDTHWLTVQYFAPAFFIFG